MKNITPEQLREIEVWADGLYDGVALCNGLLEKYDLKISVPDRKTVIRRYFKQEKIKVKTK